MSPRGICATIGGLFTSSVMAVWFQVVAPLRFRTMEMRGQVAERMQDNIGTAETADPNSAAQSGKYGNNRRLEDTGRLVSRIAIDIIEIEAILRAFIKPLVRLLEPHSPS